MLTIRLRRVAVVALVAVMVVGCGRVQRFFAEQPGPLINGIQMGPGFACPPDGSSDCTEHIGLAARHLDEVEPGHAEVVGVRLFGDTPGVTRSGSNRFVVFELADGRVVVAAVYCGVGGCQADLAPR